MAAPMAVYRAELGANHGKCASSVKIGFMRSASDGQFIFALISGRYRRLAPARVAIDVPRVKGFPSTPGELRKKRGGI
jgi:hypothetical protein